MNKINRSAGVLLNVSSLPSAYGIGGFGREINELCDFLLRGGFHYWQILPLSTIGLGDSPYSGQSAFAGNYLYIDPDRLVEDGYVDRRDAEECIYRGEPYVTDYAFARGSKRALLKKAFLKAGEHAEEISEFELKHKSWIGDYAAYMTLKDRYGGLPWWQWEDRHKLRDKAAMLEVKGSEEYAFYIFEQFIFDRQWGDVKRYLKSRDIKIIGDMPMYVSLDSSDVWGAPELYQLDDNLSPTAVAGVPPDYFSEEGQLWGNPLYDIDYHVKTGYKWWISRLARACEWYDVLRIDHFRAFSRYWSVPVDAPTAKTGEWKEGLGLPFLKAVSKALPNALFIAEDLGIIDDATRKLLADSGLPGMRVMQFGFEDGDSAHLPHNFDRHCIGYTATHDNNTTLGWLQGLNSDTLDYVLRYIGCDAFGWGNGGYGCKSTKAFIKKLLESCCTLAIVPFQDMCGFGADCRMNTPGVADNNWRYRATYENFGGVDTAFFNSVNSLYGRNRI
ncbi:MAG: 4-alpha-glucanotransferase [Clostridia bacterium]|nr:4-alpha-glucanotransferase [Clostridia bacterium]